MPHCDLKAAKVIPDFQEAGLLPPGIHPASWDEFAERFVQFQETDRRIRIGERLKSLYHEIRTSGIVRRLIVAGSYVTGKASPNDFDCVLVLDPAVVTTDLRPSQYNLVSRRMARRLYGGDVFAAIEGSEALEEYLRFFQTTRDGESMGVVEIEQ